MRRLVGVPAPDLEAAYYRCVIVPVFDNPEEGTSMTNPYEHLEHQELVALDNMYGIVMQNRTIEIEKLRERIKQINAEIRVKEDHISDVERRHRQVIDVITSRPAFTVTPEPGTDTVLITTADEEVIMNPKHANGMLRRLNEIASRLAAQQSHK